MLSRRALLAGGAALAASPIVAGAQTSPAEAPVAGGGSRPSSSLGGATSR